MKARVDVSGEHPGHQLANKLLALLDPLDWEQQLNCVAYLAASVTHEHGVAVEQLVDVVRLYHASVNPEDPSGPIDRARLDAAGAELGVEVTDGPARPAAAPAGEPSSETLNKSAQALGRTIAEVLPAGWGFLLMLFTFTNSTTAYVSNAQRADAIKAIRELADRLEGD